MTRLSLFLVGLFCVTLICSCGNDDCDGTYTYMEYTPIYMSPEDLRAAIGFEDARELKAPGKIYFYNNIVFINELGRGVHVFDNSDLTNPVNLGFLNIPGNYDIAIKDDILYADNSFDLISIDISNVQEPAIADIEEGIFTTNFDDVNGIFLYYEISDRTIQVSCDEVYYGNTYYLEEDILFVSDVFSPTSSGFDANAGVIANTGPETGVGGSFARFTISQNHLYTIDELNLNVFDLANCRNPAYVSTTPLEWGIETIFPYEDKLFVGANNGLFIFDNSNPASPSLESRFEHARACDPVYVENDLAYVTLRNGNTCQGFVNQLDIINIENLESPFLIASHEMINPHGLSVRNEEILLCEGESGLKILDASDALQLELLEHIDDFHAYDVISLSDGAIMIIGNDGFYQYEKTQDNRLNLLSHIPITE